MDRSQLELRKRHTLPIDLCLSLVELALIEQAGDKAAAAIINCLAEISHRESGKVDGESLYDLGLGLRTVNGLEEAGIFSVSQLVKSTAIELLQLPGFGATTLASVEEGLSARGMKLKPEAQPPTPGGTPFLDSISGDVELAKYKTGLTDCVKRGIVAGGNGSSKSGIDSRQEASKTPCQPVAEFRSNNHVGPFPKPERQGRRAEALIVAAKANAARIAKKLAGRQKKKPPSPR